MIATLLSSMWPLIAPALGNHLWQSSLFGIAAGLLTLILRKNHARTRYWLWLVASMKFLIPFSLLVDLGSHLDWSHGSAGTNAGLYFAIAEVSQPFTQPVTSIIPRATPSTISSSLIHLLPALLAAAWLCGFLAVVFVWYLRWRRVSNALRNAEPLRVGREVETLRRLERFGGRGKRIEMFLSWTSLEPGIFGIVRPVLVWPKGISERLGDAHLEAILAHEVWHVRRRDNLAAAQHMFVEALFWFHPLVWWLGARLVEERERACDEAVLESGSDRQVYAESILKICEFCVGSPLACVSGVTGADLKKRMVHIMTKSVSPELDFGRKLLLSAAGLLAVAAPIAIGLLQVTQTRAASQAQNIAANAPTFETASIKPNGGEPMAGFEIVGKPFNAIMWKADRLMATNFTLHGLIRVAFAIQDDQISGGPDWLNSEGYDIDAKIGKSGLDEMKKRGRVYGVNGRTLMLQALLSDRFKLKFHHETRKLPVYALVIPKSGPKIQQAKPGDTYPDGLKCSGGRPCGAGVILAPESGKLVGQGVTIPTLVEDLSSELGGRIVVDKTGLAGNYDFTLKWTPVENQAAIFTALEEQLGLKLETQKLPIDVLVIDHAEEPSEPQAQNKIAIEPVSEVASVKPNKSENPSVRIESQAQNTAATASAYEVGSIKRNKSDNGVFRMMFEQNGFIATNVTLRMLIRAAYGVEDGRIFGEPNWLNSEKYDIETRMASAVADGLRKINQDQRYVENRRMLQAFLADRFKLTLHRETKQVGAYVLVSAKNGRNLEEAKPGDAYLNGIRDNGEPLGPGVYKLGRYVGGRGELIGQALPMATLVQLLSEKILNRSVLENTGLTGNYDFTLQWTIAGESQGPMFKEARYDQQATGSAHSPESPGPSFFTALQDQLGLKLESQNGPGEILVIDHVEKPSEN